MGKKMEEHLPFAMAWWHNLGANGVDMFGQCTADKSFGQAPGTMEYAKAKVDAGFEFMKKLGSIDANQGDPLLGWDTDEFPCNVYDATLAMYEVLKSGGLTGGFNFDSKNRRPSYTYEDMFHAFILGMDTFALGLIKAAELIKDGRIDNFVNEKYSSFQEGIGKKIRDKSTTLQECSDYALKMKKPELPGSGSQEYLEAVLNNVLFK